MTAAPRIAVLIMAAGKGVRAGEGVPKQYRPVLGTPLILRTIDALDLAVPQAEISLVAAEGDQHFIETLSSRPFISGGATRQESVRKGLEALAADPPDIVLIHDAARPFASPATVDRLLGALAEGWHGAAPGVPIADSVKRCSMDGTVEASVARNRLWRVQTPQAFVYSAILEAHRTLEPGLDMSDDLAVAEHARLNIKVVNGEDSNFKITTSDDFERAERHMMNALSDIRTGQGFDVHAFSEGDHVTLCGVRIPHDQGLEGHSDADVGLHAITDAILGCIAAGDIGAHFPPSDPRWKGAASSVFLDHALRLVVEKGGVIAHVDVTLICEAPKIGPHRDAMAAQIGEILKLPPGRVSVKATTTERLGFTGRREGIAAMATATVRLP